jgi:arginase
MRPIINFSSRLGQKKIGLEKTGVYIKPKIKNTFIDVPCINNVKPKNFFLINNLWNLYYQNILTCDNKINLGGDHSMSIATVADSLNRVKQDKLKVLWFDAHADINTYKSSKTKNFHGMPLSFLTGLSNYHEFSFINNKLNLNNLLYIGIRDLDKFEQSVLEKYKISFLTVDNINKNPEKSCKLIKQFIDNDPYHLSFDVDVMDPKILSSTGTPVNNGLKLKNTKFIIDNLSKKNMINMDIAELNLEIGDKKKSMKNILHLFDEFLIKK